jgi:hypothetical protein
MGRTTSTKWPRGLITWQLNFGVVFLLGALVFASYTVILLLLGLQSILSAIYLKHRNDYLDLDERITAIEDGLSSPPGSSPKPPPKDKNE